MSTPLNRVIWPSFFTSIVIFSLIALIAKLINDLLYVFVDPRVKFEGS